MNKSAQYYIRPRWDFIGSRKGIMTIEGLPITELLKKHGTPLYVMVERKIRERIKQFKKAFPYPKLRVQYATKCNSNLEIMRIANQEGIELDASSTGEIILALLADFMPHEITFTNLHKSQQDILFAARIGVQAITADSIEDIEQIQGVGKKLRKKIRIFLRFNPVIDLGSYSTRKLQYGIPYPLYKRAVDMAVRSPYLDFVGLHFHGSYISNPKVYFIAAKKLFKIVEYALSAHNHRIKYFDLGGGFPVSLGDEEVFQPEDMGKKFSDFFLRQVYKLNIPLPTLIFEPGKFLVQNAGVGLVQVVSKKKAQRSQTLIVDGSTYAFLPDPLIYGTEYEVLPATKMNQKPEFNYRLSGCTCDSIDVLRKGAHLPPMERGDVLAIMDVGAYSNTMASNFNSLRRAPMVMVNADGVARLIRRRDRYSDMFAPELDVLKVADPHELQRYYNIFRVNLDKLWGAKAKEKKKKGTRRESTQSETLMQPADVTPPQGT